MAVPVPQEVLDRTTDCPYDFACLSGDSRPACTVVRADGQDVLFVVLDDPPVCPYVLHWGGGAMCRCPVHFYLHQHQGAEA